ASKQFCASTALPGACSPKTLPKKPPPEEDPDQTPRARPARREPPRNLRHSPSPHRGRPPNWGATTPGSPPPSPEPSPPGSLQIRARGAEEAPGGSLPDREPARKRRRPSLPLSPSRAATAAA
uniref:Uncharacterized protein n=1 Tax=Oryza brachyantha TaxID=4533 RepID=J3N2T9_ORYBR